MKSTLPYRCWAEIDGSALRYNLNALRRHVGPATQIMAVVKANAYGHGLDPIAREAVAWGVDWLGVANIPEAREIRRHGVKQPILLLGAGMREEIIAAAKERFVSTLSNEEEARWLDRAGAALGRRVEAHFKIDTGMGRLGTWHEDSTALLNRILRLKHVRVTGIYTHFASADSDPTATARQLRLFQAALPLQGKFLIHAANSAGIFAPTPFQPGCVRAGILIYGVSPMPGDMDLRPVLAWKSRVTLLRDMPAGRSVSYGSSYRLPKAQKIAVIGAGYGDGYFRALSNKADVLVGGQRCPIRGRVTMDQILVDVSRVPKVRVGMEAVLLGRQGAQEICARELAGHAGTIPYEILTNVGLRVPRRYKNFLADL